MQKATLLLLAALVTVAYAGGQFYVPRAYYIIDSDGHESAPVPLRRLRRSLNPPASGAYAVSTANNYGPVNAEAKSYANNGYPGDHPSGWLYPGNSYGASNPNAKS